MQTRNERKGSTGEHAVVIAGAGPTGLMLACELALARVDVVIVERRADQQLAGLRAGGLHARSVEILDQRGVAERFVAEGQKHKVAPYAHSPLDLSELPSRHNGVLALFQNRIEQLLADWAAELSVPILRARDVTGFTQDDGGVEVALSDGSTLRAQYLVGCDGGRSFVRKHAGIEFPGWEASTSYVIAEVEMHGEPPFGFRRDARGTHALGKLEDGRRVRAVLEEAQVQHGEPSLRELSELLIAIYGSDFGVHSPTWISRFSDAARQAVTYRSGRVLLAGDAAHVHTPMGGQGLNTGVQDAMNLGWKLALVVKGTSPDSLLDSYHAERHPVGARVLRTTMALTALARGDDRSEALRETMAELMGMSEPRRRYAARIAGLDIHYDLGSGHPLLGRRMPDLDVVTERGAERVFTLLYEARPVLLDLGAHLDLGPWADRVRHVTAHHEGGWELPVFGEVSAPAAVLIRPDGHVAWLSDGSDHGLHDALARWFGPA
jgi:3-(3-hydroxy-phenyl)propionate hydroxylase